MGRANGRGLASHRHAASEPFERGEGSDSEADPIRPGIFSFTVVDQPEAASSCFLIPYNILRANPRLHRFCFSVLVSVLIPPFHQ